MRDFSFGIDFAFKKLLSLHIICNQMAKNYFYIILLFFSLLSFDVLSQESKGVATNKSQEPTIAGLNIYPNPTSSGKIYVTTKSSLDKKIEIFDVLGKKVLETITSSKEINISALTPGVYFIKVKEGEASATRKLIIN
ncbi:T9SS type A sorting domain-containing protein [Flavobacterium chuncheonense]